MAWGPPSEGVACAVPRSQAVDLHLLATSIIDALDGREYRFLHRLMEARAVVRRVGESILLLVRVVAGVVEARVLCGLLAKVVHAVEDARDHVALLDIWLGA